MRTPSFSFSLFLIHTHTLSLTLSFSPSLAHTHTDIALLHASPPAGSTVHESFSGAAELFASMGAQAKREVIQSHIRRMDGGVGVSQLLDALGELPNLPAAIVGHDSFMQVRTFKGERDRSRRESEIYESHRGKGGCVGGGRNKGEPFSSTVVHVYFCLMFCCT